MEEVHDTHSIEELGGHVAFPQLRPVPISLTRRITDIRLLFRPVGSATKVGLAIFRDGSSDLSHRKRTDSAYIKRAVRKYQRHNVVCILFSLLFLFGSGQCS